MQPLVSSPTANLIQLGGGNIAAASLVQPSIQIDGQNSLGWFALNYNSNVAAGGHFGALYKNGVQDAPAVGKKWIIYAVCGFTNAANTSFQLAHTSTVFANDAAALVAGVYQGGAAAAYPFTFYSLIFQRVEMIFEVPAGSYPAIQLSNATSVGGVVWAREVSV